MRCFLSFCMALLLALPAAAELSSYEPSIERQRQARPNRQSIQTKHLVPLSRSVVNDCFLLQLATITHTSKV